MAMTDEQRLALNSALNPGIQLALPQTVVPVVKTQNQVSGVQYDPVKLQALKSALTAPRQKMDKWEAFANALAQTPESRSFTGGFGEEIINPWSVGLSALARGFGNTYGALKANERDVAEQEREDAIKAAQLEAEATKQAVQDTRTEDYIKINDPKAPEADMSYRFAPEKIKELKELNDKAGRWATDWGKGVSDIANTEQSKAYNEFEGKAKQYVQDQLKKIYGAQMTEAEGERFFKSMGLSPKLDPELRWQLVENALDDLARKNNTTIKADMSKAVEDFMKGTK